CRRAPAPEPPPAAGVDLTPPAPSSSLVITPLDKAATGYTNEMQAENLRQQVKQLGIRQISLPTEENVADQGERPPVSYDEGLARTRAYARQFQAQRYEMTRAERERTVSVRPGDVPRDLSQGPGGSPVRLSTAAVPAPKGPPSP
ncbi:MAG: hypothetical protein KGM24_12980, partial [Elusimicrobia bacterium]|nr:hypothetical protein [Elusimicrobiota bacterium]